MVACGGGVQIVRSVLLILCCKIPFGDCCMCTMQWQKGVADAAVPLLTSLTSILTQLFFLSTRQKNSRLHRVHLMQFAIFIYFFQRVSLFIYFTSFPFHKTLTPLLRLLLQQLGAVLRKNTNHLLLNKCIFSHVGFTFIFIITIQHTTVHLVNSGKEFPFPSFLSKQTQYSVYLFFVGL